jgi:hypothetical protein
MTTKAIVLDAHIMIRAVLDVLESIARPLELGIYAGLQAQALQLPQGRTN